MRVLGLDLSLTQTGYVLLDDAGEIVWHGAVGFPQLRGGERLSRFNDWLCDGLVGKRPTHVGIEGYSFGSPFHATDLAELGGIVKATLWEWNIPLSIVPPGTWRKALCGRGNIAKADIEEELWQRFAVRFPRLDTLEAWAVATYCRRRLLGLLEEPKVSRAHTSRRTR